jgi:hypothetical protein
VVRPSRACGRTLVADRVHGRSPSTGRTSDSMPSRSRARQASGSATPGRLGRPGEGDRPRSGFASHAVVLGDRVVDRRTRGRRSGCGLDA